MGDINKIFQPKFFSDSSINVTLRGDEQKIFIIPRTEKNAEIYENFSKDFSDYLMKLPNGIVKDCCRKLLNNNLIFLGIAKTKPDNVVVRLLITNEDKFAGITLDSQQLGIDPITGITDSIDECIYASYFGFIRSVILINKNSIRQNKDIHKLLTTYLYLLFIKAFGADKIYSEKQRILLHLLTIYIYYRHYLKEKHDYVLSIIQNRYTKIIDPEYIEEFLPTLEKMKSYNDIRDFSKMVVDCKIVNESPNFLTINLLKMLKPMGFYCLIGPLDYFITFVILAKYPITFIGNKIPNNEKLQNSIEGIIEKYIDNIKFDFSVVGNY
ncbi:MAG: hypothetical protein PHD05_00690 [Sphaerochaetaceae bacterium]|nr:hypothetical protein [Sphaerochaetaceae bacterium]